MHVVLGCIVLYSVAVIASGIDWPYGRYGLPKPKTGCPEHWLAGRRFTNAEELNSNSRKFKDWFHLSGFVSSQGVEQEYCTKNGEQGTGYWPPGKYCILRSGRCPKGLVEGYIHWRERQYTNQRDKKAQIPHEIKKVEYCCNANGDSKRPISLPLSKPFYLYAYGSSDCQIVKGAHVKKELVHFEVDTKTFHQGEGGAHPFEGGLDTSSHRLIYCYYTPVKTATIVNHSEQEVEKAIFSSEQLDNKSQTSAMALAIGVGIACALLGTATIAVLAKRLIGKREDDDDDETPRPDD